MDLINKLMEEGAIQIAPLYENQKDVLAFDDSINDEDFEIVSKYASNNGLELFRLDELVLIGETFYHEYDDSWIMLDYPLSIEDVKRDEYDIVDVVRKYKNNPDKLLPKSFYIEMQETLNIEGYYLYDKSYTVYYDDVKEYDLPKTILKEFNNNNFNVIFVDWNEGPFSHTYKTLIKAKA